MVSRPPGENAPTVRHVLTIFAVADVEAAAAFYCHAFGWQEQVRTPVYIEFRLPLGLRFGVYRREHFAHNTGILPDLVSALGSTAAEIYLHCDAIDDVMDRLAFLGARQLSALAPRAWGDDAAYFQDLDGNTIVVARPQLSEP